MVNKNLVGRCGLYCGACAIYRAYKDNNGEYLAKLAQHFKCLSEKVRCEGCMALTPECWGYNCEIVQCLRNRGLEFCYQCSEYESETCEKFENLAKPYLEEDGVDMRANLERIRRGETEEWLIESEEKCKCPICGKPLSTGAIKRKCYHCGADLSKKKL
ncbi:MAG: DUF3795 domain-containing protein [Candidatus Bathyarchaeota archaeon]|nr:DUF3795 domain-containing protein [Candidatus Bathyarchaeota archaeon]